MNIEGYWAVEGNRLTSRLHGNTMELQYFQQNGAEGNWTIILDETLSQGKGRWKYLRGRAAEVEREGVWDMSRSNKDLVSQTLIRWGQYVQARGRNEEAKQWFLLASNTAAQYQASN